MSKAHVEKDVHMTLTIIRLCYAVFAYHDSADPLHVTCLDFAKPVQYDVRECPGEVITPRGVRVKDARMATCEVSMREDQ